MFPKRRQESRRAVVGVGVGGALEAYDWAVYSTFAPFFASEIFDGDDRMSAVLATLAVFAVGFLARPLGGLFFGVLADRRGRRFAMAWSMVVTAAGGLVIAATPTYSSVGGAASVLLVAGRFVQGFGFGGELGASYTFLAESAPAARRGLWSSSVYASITCGTLAATLTGALLTSTLDPAQLTAWGWRVPFGIGTALGFYGWLLRRRLPETTAFKEQPDRVGHTGILSGVWQHRSAVIRVIGLTTGGTIALYTWLVAAPGYAITVGHMDPGSVLWAGVAANLVFITALPVWGALSDRFGRKPVVIAFAVGTAFVTVVFRGFVRDQAWQLALAMSVALVFLAAVSAIAPALFAELFPTRVRAVGMSLPYSVTVALFGGTAPLVQTWLAVHQRAELFAWYTIALLGTTLITILATPESKGLSLTA
jgi:MHS family alpha-ketoglutarate permease-like MFS transporter